MSQERSGKFRSPTGEGMSAALNIRDDLATMLPRVLQRTQKPAKILSFDAGVSKRTIEGVRRGENQITVPALFALARKYPGVKALVLSLVDAETGDSGEHPSAAMDKIFKQMTRAKA